MSRVKRQHFNPQTYLRRFADDDEQVMVYDRITGKTWKTHVRNAAVEKDLYTVYDPDGNPSDVYETTWIQWFDDGVADVIAKLLHPNAPLTDADQKFLCMFLAFQHMRSPYMRQTMGNFTDLMVRSELAANVEGKSAEEINQFIDEWLADFPEEERERFRKIGHDLSIPLEIDTEAWIRASLRHVPGIAESLETRAWALVEVQDASLLTADIPLALAGPHALRIESAPSIIWPVSPSRVLLLGPPGSHDGRSFKRIVVRSDFAPGVNQQIALAAARHIFWHPETDPVTGIILPTGPHTNTVGDITIGTEERFFDVIRREFGSAFGVEPA